MELNSLISLHAPRNVLFFAPVAFAWSYCCLSVASYLKTEARLRTGYTRKVFHVLIFISAAMVQALGGFSAVCLFGMMVSLVVGHAILCGPGNGRYEALAREQDGPHRTYYIVVSFFATMIGGLASNVFFGPIAAVGYLVGGLGDAAGEPVGTRWGKHAYSIGGAMRTKTFEGSIAVLAASLVALLIGVVLRPELSFNVQAAIAIPAIAIVCTVVEALSPRGWDNVPMQIVPTALVAILLSR